MIPWQQPPASTEAKTKQPMSKFTWWALMIGVVMLVNLIAVILKRV